MNFNSQWEKTNVDFIGLFFINPYWLFKTAIYQKCKPVLQLLQEMSVYRRNRPVRRSPSPQPAEDVLALFEHIDQHIEGDWAPFVKGASFQKGIYPNRFI